MWFVFQVHLEADPNLFEDDEAKYAVLKESNQARLDILTNLLTTLEVDAKTAPQKPLDIAYVPAFFLGRHEVHLISTYHLILANILCVSRKNLKCWEA